MPLPGLVTTAPRFRPGTPGTLEAATKLALKALAARYQHLDAEIAELDAQIGRLARQASPSLMRVKGVGADTAAALAVGAGDNPSRLHSEAAFAHMCGVAPIPASSGKTLRHQLNRGGNREANRAIYMLAIHRLSYDPRARAGRRTTEAKSKREIVRCLKRYLAREIYQAIMGDNAIPPSASPRPADQAA